MPPDPHVFAEKLRRALVKAGVVEEATYDRENFALRFPEGGNLFLTNAFDEYRRASFFSRRATLKRWVLSAKEQREHQLPATFAEAQANLLPQLRDLPYLDQVRLMQRIQSPKSAPMFPTRPLASELVVALAYDSPRTIATLAQQVLDDWGVSLDEALKPAQFNLRARTAQGLVLQGPGVFVSPYQDNYDASRIVLTELISRLAVKGDPVAFVPHRDSLIVTGSEDSEGLLQACALAEPLLKENRRISGQPLVFRGGRWEPFQVAPEAPTHEPLRRLRFLQRLADYGQQQDILQRLLGEGTFVAQYQVVETDGKWFSYSVWSEGVPTSLPITDKVFLHSERFAKDDPRRGMRAWTEVERVAGTLMEKEDRHPARVTVKTFPTEEMLAALPTVAST